MIDFEGWKASAVAENEFLVQPIPFAESKEWSFRDGRLVHRSGGFFELAGLRAEARHPSLNDREQLIIRQRTVAINGLLLRHVADRCEILFQGRIEPGNIGAMQLAPTVQSTEANYKRLHGGKATAFIDYFLEEGAEFIYDELQSEEGSRYHGKYNRNVLRLLDAREIAPHPNFRFMPFGQVRQLVETSNTLNTDSRSVLFCVDWKYLTWPHAPFAEAHGELPSLLARSYREPASETGTPPFEALAWLARLRASAAIATEPVALEKLNNWTIENDRIVEKERELGFAARQFRVVARHREVPGWDQPLIDSSTRGKILLLCQVRDGVLQFLVAASYEIGFLEGVQLSASVNVPPGSDEDALSPAERRLLDLAAADRSRLIAGCVQSEEGGRFYQDENRYEIVLLDPAADLPPSDAYRWMTLSQIAALKPVSGVFTMEMRCVLVLLFKYL